MGRGCGVLAIHAIIDVGLLEQPSDLISMGQIWCLYGSLLGPNWRGKGFGGFDGTKRAIQWAGLEGRGGRHANVSKTMQVIRWVNMRCDGKAGMVFGYVPQRRRLSQRDLNLI